MAIKVSGTTVIDDSRNLQNSVNLNVTGNVYANTFIGDGSQLTNLPPSGGTVTATASGTLSDGSAVVLNADGTVSVVGDVSASLAEDVGTETQFQNGNPEFAGAAFHAASGKVVIAYRDGLELSYGKVVVGTVSGDTISFGTPVTFLEASTSNCDVVYDPVAEKVVVFFTAALIDTGYVGNGYAIVGTVTGTSISFGSRVSWSTQNPGYNRASYDSSAGKIVIAFMAQSSGNYATAIVGTVSGTSISFGSAVVFRSANTSEFACVYDTNANKTVILYRESSVTGAGEGIVGTVSGTSISFGTAVQFDSASVNYVRGAYDSLTNQIICAYAKSGIRVVLGTVSGTSISFGSIVTAPVSTSSTYNAVCYDSNVNKIVLVYALYSTDGKIATGTVSGTSVTFATQASFNLSGVSEHMAAVYDSTNKKTVVAYGEDNASGEALVFQPAGTGDVLNLTSENYLGISNGAYANNTTATIQVAGAVDDAQSSLTPGQQYFVQANGSIDTTAGSPSVVAGTAVAATKLLVKG